MKVDLLMCARNSERTLAYVLKGIERAIPHEVINQKIFIDGHSKDKTVKIAKKFNWNVISQKGETLGTAMNEGLALVETDLFVTVESDLLLCKNWFLLVSKYINDENVLCVQGVRYIVNPFLHKIETSYEPDVIYINANCTLDNCLFKTDILRQLGGFPLVKWYVDRSLLEIVNKTKYTWLVLGHVISFHLKLSTWDHLLKTAKHSENPFQLRSVLHSLRHGFPVSTLFSLAPLFKRKER